MYTCIHFNNTLSYHNGNITFLLQDIEYIEKNFIRTLSGEALFDWHSGYTSEVFGSTSERKEAVKSPSPLKSEELEPCNDGG